MSPITPSQLRILSDIREYLDDSRTIGRNSVRMDKDRRNFYAQAMILFALTNRLIDLGREVVYSCGYARNDEQLKNKVIFKRLNDYEIIDRTMREELISLVNFRNRCSHHFYEITWKDLEMVRGKEDIIENFVNLMESELKQKKRITRLGIALVGVILLIIAGYLICCII